ncbi:hypothetical protein PV08_01076 [Exophiala spinifera]|uniref:Uncharacterized protein n=1 Tax=Exophiala spinifera TaxID=91928 RepID=A0A0D1YZ27_9EURO|nr:uncharacterized protein PV08_01076 [Exophiala spinifera]KIW20501.1 hypothetical protein PV08_01076 [Exophiala spinifera]
MHLAFWPQRDPRGRLTQGVVDAIENSRIYSPRIREELLKSSYRKEGSITSKYWKKDSRDDVDHKKGERLPSSTKKASQKIGYEPAYKARQPFDNLALGRPPTPKPRNLLSRRASSMPPMGCTEVAGSTFDSSGTNDDSDHVEHSNLAGRDALQHDDPPVAASPEISSSAVHARTITPTDARRNSHSGSRLRPLGNGKRLKRRTGTLSNGRGKKQNRGSIFDLAEDDGDNETRPPASSTATLVDRPKQSVSKKCTPRKLYLPR